MQGGHIRVFNNAFQTVPLCFPSMDPEESDLFHSLEDFTMADLEFPVLRLIFRRISEVASTGTILGDGYLEDTHFRYLI